MDRTTYVTELHKRFGLDFPAISALVKDATQRKVASAERVIKGDEYEVHRVQLTDGSVVYLRVAQPGTSPIKVRHEAWAMEQARDGGVPVPEVLAVQSIESADGDRVAMVLREAPGRQLRYVVPLLSADQRSAVLAELGRTLRTLHSITMPGAGVPGEEGRWTDLESKRQQYVASVLDDTRHLTSAGLTSAEVEQVIKIVQESDIPLEDPPVLCHGDLSEEHVFVDSDLRVVGVIDWGLWYAGSAASELAGMAMGFAAADLESIIAGHGFPMGPASRSQIRWHLITQATGQIRWLVGSGQAEVARGPAAVIRQNLDLVEH